MRCFPTAPLTVTAADVSYTPTVPGDWDGPPTQGQEAWDELAARVRTLPISGPANQVLATPNGSTGATALRALVYPDLSALVPQRINVDPKYVGQDQDIYVPGKYDVAGLGAGTQLDGAVNLLQAFTPGENISLRYVSITVHRKGALYRALVVAEYPKEAYICYREETPWYKETPIIRDPSVWTIGQNWSSTTLGRRR